MSRQEKPVPQCFAQCKPRPVAGVETADGSPGAYGQSGPPQSPASQPAMPAQKSPFASLAPGCHGAELLKPGAQASPTLSHTHSYFISKTQESVLSKRSDMTKTSVKWAFPAQIAFTGTDIRHPSG